MRRYAVLILIAVACERRHDADFRRLRMAVPGRFEPVAPSNSASLTVLAQTWVFEPIVHLSPSGELVPHAAREVTRLPDGRFRIIFRSDIVFSDGSRLTSTDIEASLRAGGLRVENDSRGFLVSSDSPGLVEHLLLRTVLFHSSGHKVLGSGPFVIAETDDDHIVLSRRQRREGYIDEVSLLRFASPKDAFVHTLKGDADLLVQIEPRWLEFFDAVPRFRVVRGRGIQTDSVMFGPSLDRDERRRLARILATDEVARAAYGPDCRSREQNRATPASGSRLDVVTIPLYGRLALAARRALGERGGAVTTIEDSAAYREKITEGAFELATGSIISWPPSSIALAWHSRSPLNLVHYANPEVDAALDAGDWQRAARGLDEDPPVAMVCTHDRVAVVDARVKNPTLGNYDLLETLPDWEMSE